MERLGPSQGDEGHQKEMRTIRGGGEPSRERRIIRERRTIRGRRGPSQRGGLS